MVGSPVPVIGGTPSWAERQPALSHRPNSGTRPIPRETAFQPHSGAPEPPPAWSCCGGSPGMRRPVRQDRPLGLPRPAGWSSFIPHRLPNGTADPVNPRVSRQPVMRSGSSPLRLRAARQPVRRTRSGCGPAERPSWQGRRPWRAGTAAGHRDSRRPPEQACCGQASRR